MSHKAGYVNIIGEPNAGKSTLMNTLTGEKLSIISPKAQTTRHRILGIINDENHQIIFSDTPGILDPSNKLHQAMMSAVNEAITDADVFLLVHDANQEHFKSETILNALRNSGVPVIVAINKIDMAGQDLAMERVEAWKKLLPQAKVLAISALHGAGREAILEEIKVALPESPPYYPKDQLTDKNERFFVSEIIREKILSFYEQEIPYSVEVAIDSFKEKPDITVIKAFILVMRESQKGILIGRGGTMLKKVGTAARRDIEKFLDKKVFLELQVKVVKNWRDDPMHLKRFGYN